MITIVSGLPRCGTSLMMRMLDLGGIPALVDHLRQADIDNPLGYFEFEPVKRTQEDPSWLAQADGKCVKMVSQLLYDLPGDHEYHVVFMKRDLSEMVASQNKMLERLGKPLAEDDARMTALMQKHVEQVESWLAARENFKVLYVSYNRVLADPRPEIERVCAFLGVDLDRDAMLRSIDKDLYRQRKTALS